MPLSPQFRNTVLDLVLGGVKYAALHTKDGEISGGGYGRKPVQYAAARAGTKENASVISWKNCPRVSQDNPITEVVLYDEIKGGTALWPMAVVEKKGLNAGDELVIDVGALVNSVT